MDWKKKHLTNKSLLYYWCCALKYIWKSTGSQYREPEIVSCDHQNIYYMFLLVYRLKIWKKLFWSWQRPTNFALRFFYDQSRTCQKQTKEVSSGGDWLFSVEHQPHLFLRRDHWWRFRCLLLTWDDTTIPDVIQYQSWRYYYAMS